jgi:aryl-alcohol dehydrogenase-like predicted oxidoreductase
MAWEQAVLGRTGRAACRLGLACSYGADDRCVAMAAERGVNYFYFGTFRRGSFAAGLKRLRQLRERILVVVQSYSRIPALLGWSLERALRALEMDYADVLLLGLWNKPVSPSVLDAARRLRERGRVRHLALSTHHRPLAPKLSAAGDIDILHVRYNAIHRGAEREIFPLLPARESRSGIVSFTATSWGQLLKPAKVPPGDRIPSAADCYRFVMTNPAVDVCLSGPKDAAQFQSALDALSRGPMSPDELAWMQRVGQAKYGKPEVKTA